MAIMETREILGEIYSILTGYYREEYSAEEAYKQIEYFFEMPDLEKPVKIVNPLEKI